MERVKTRLLLCLERMARLQIRVLHDPAQPDGREAKEKEGLQLRTPISYVLLYLFLFKANQNTKTDSSLSDTHRCIKTGWLTFGSWLCIQNLSVNTSTPPLLSTHSPLKLHYLPTGLVILLSQDAERKKDDSARRMRNKCETSEHKERQNTGALEGRQVIGRAFGSKIKNTY